MKTLIMCAAMGVCATGCAQSSFPTHYQVYIDQAFGDNVDDVLTALDVWQDALGTDAIQFDVAIRNYTAEDHGDYGVISIHTDTLSDIRAKVGSSLAIGATKHFEPYNGWGDTYIEKNFKTWTILHEIGHGLGLEHRGAGVVMCQDIACGVPRVTCSDANQYRRDRGMSEKVCHDIQ